MCVIIFPFCVFIMYSIIFYYVLLLCFYLVFLYILLRVFILLLFAWFEKPKPNTQRAEMVSPLHPGLPRLLPTSPKCHLHEAMHARHTHSPSTCRFLPCPISFKPLTPYSPCHAHQLPPLIPKSLSTLTSPLPAEPCFLHQNHPSTCMSPSTPHPLAANFYVSLLFYFKLP